MINNNHKKSGCGFDEELVSYIYGEADAAGAAKFEAHLATCSICTDELEAFSGVHFKISDWKAAEFTALETPAIEIPYPQASKQKVSAGNESWLSAFVRDLLSFSSRGLSLAAASVAVLAVAVGAVLFLLNSPSGQDVAGANKTTKPVIAPTVEKTPEPAKSNQNNPPQTESNPTPPQNPPQSEVADQPQPKNNRVVKVTNNPRPTPKAENTNTPKNTNVKRNNKDKEIAPQTIPDEDVDDSLRLAELFEEIDTKD